MTNQDESRLNKGVILANDNLTATVSMPVKQSAMAFRISRVGKMTDARPLLDRTDEMAD